MAVVRPGRQPASLLQTEQKESSLNPRGVKAALFL